MGHIYIIKNRINEKVYIGQTVKTIQERWSEHLYNAKNSKRNQLLYIAMRKYGINNFYIEELTQNSNGESLDELEIQFIAQYNSISPNGYNTTKGGSKFKDDNPMYHEEIKKKVSQHLIGEKNPAKRSDVKEKIRQKALGRKASDEARKKMKENSAKYWLGKKHTLESRKKISQNHGCRGKFGGLNPNSKTVQRLDKDTLEVLEEYDSLATAGKWAKENVKSSASWTGISKVCHGIQKTAFGYVWRLVNPLPSISTAINYNKNKDNKTGRC